MQAFDAKLKNLKKMYNNNVVKGGDYIETNQAKTSLRKKKNRVSYDLNAQPHVQPMMQPDGRYSAKDTRPVYTSSRKYDRLIINNPHGNNSGLRNVSRSMGVTTKNQYTKGNIDSLFKPNRRDNDEVIT